MSELPDASFQHPACGACRGETESDGDSFTCHDCQLAFNPDDLSASFLDPDASICGAPCDNYWHGPDKIKAGVGFNCGTCALPTGHESAHWQGCESTKAGQ